MPDTLNPITTPASSASGQFSSSRSEDHLRTVFLHSPIGQIVSDMSGAIVAVNAPMAEMLGWDPDDMIGLSARDFVPPSEHADLIADATALATGRTESTNTTRHFLHRDGHQVEVSVASALLRGDDDEPRWWISMVRDITDEQVARREIELAHEAAVRAAARLRLLHAIVALANDAMTLDEVVPLVLSLAVDRPDCCAATSLRWTTNAAAPRVARHVGVEHDWSDLSRPEGSALQVHELADAVRVVMPLHGDRHVRAIGFLVTRRPDQEQLDILALVKHDLSCVIERETAARRLSGSEARFRSIFDASPLPMGLTLGDTGTYSAVNDALCALVGRDADDLIGRSARDICHPDDVVLADPAGAAALASPDHTHCFEVRLLHSSGRVVHTEVTLTWITGSGGAKQLLTQLSDVTERRTFEAKLRRRAEEDDLTGLHNRTKLHRELSRLSREGSAATALFVDLDGFKLVNDTRGHDIGDEVLCEVARRLRDVTGPEHLVARFGGDQFVLLGTPAVPDPSDLGAFVADASVVTAQDSCDDIALAERIREALGRPVATSGGHASITASIGIARGRIDPRRPQALIERADNAMYEAKRLGRDRYALSDAALRQRAVVRARTEAALRNALDESRFVVHYQPIVRLRDRTITGFEALVRLLDEDGSLVPPVNFIGVAEQSGLIVPMGTWVLRESCRRVAWLRAETNRPLTVSVNVAARQAARPDFAELVLRTVNEAGLPDDALALELTESALLEADEATLRQLEMLRGHGVGIALDDFGTGYSSLTYLRQFPVSHVKVDRSFVAGMMLEPNDRAIVRAVTGLATDLGITWVAEGVETREQHAALTGLGTGWPVGADIPIPHGAYVSPAAPGALGQGYLYSPPVPAGELKALLADDVLDRPATTADRRTATSVPRSA